MSHEVGVTDEFIKSTIASGKQYCMSFYKAGPHRNQPPAEAEKLQMEHLRHLFRLRAEGKLLVNGPITDDEELRGVSIYATSDKEDARRLLEAAPAVKAGRLTYEIHSWFGIPGDRLPK
jgi:uncharacterized protein YciI